MNLFPHTGNKGNSPFKKEKVGNTYERWLKHEKSNKVKF